jgi:hypothetical protein
MFYEDLENDTIDSVDFCRRGDFNASKPDSVECRHQIKVTPTCVVGANSDPPLAESLVSESLLSAQLACCNCSTVYAVGLVDQ